MRYAGHRDTAETLLEIAGSLARDTRTAIAAGEMIWGATTHAFSAVERHPSDRTHRQPTRRQMLAIIVTMTPDAPTRNELVRDLNPVQRSLHDYFYSRALTHAQLASDLSSGMIFVRRLLQFAERGRF